MYLHTAAFCLFEISWSLVRALTVHAHAPPQNMHGALQIGEALKRFGVGEDAKHLLVAKLDASSEDVSLMRRYCVEQLHGSAHLS